jgi:hypothetical protein
VNDLLENAQTHAAHADEGDVATTTTERPGDGSTADVALYSVEDRRHSGEWRVVGEFIDPKMAHQVAALLRSAGGIVRVELIPHPLIP